MPTWPHQSNMNAFYGNPDKNRDGRPDPDWVAANIIQFKPPYTLYYPLEKIVNGRKTLIKRQQQFKTLSFHKKAADSLIRCLSEIPKQFSPQEIEKYELDICGGTFVFRLMRNGRSLSIHSWGSAIDLSHLINWYGRKYDPNVGMMPIKVIKIFEAEGWVSGYKWKTGDSMHFQAAKV